MKTVVPGVLTIGLFDQTFSHNPSATAHQPLPTTIRYVPGADHTDECDVVLATPAAVNGYPCPFNHPRRVLWLLENREFEPHPPYEAMAGYDLILSNDRALVKSLGMRAKWLSLIGTWIDALADMPAKTRLVSMISSAKRQTSGHKLRHEIAAMGLVPDEDCYGVLFGRHIADKGEALWPYRFSVVVEPGFYDCFASEKIFDCMATRTVPLYRGSPDLTPLEDLGFDLEGILAWQTLDELRCLIEEDITRPGRYEHFVEAVEHNYALARKLYCTEVLLEKMLRQRFGFLG